jgi:hypothetical protein
VTRRRCTRRAEPKGNRKKGRCLRWARPEAHKKSDAKRVFKLGEYGGRGKRLKLRRQHA